MRKNYFFLSLFLLSFFLFSCAKKGYLETFDEFADGWLRKPPVEEFPTHLEPENIQIEFIINERLNEAADKLQEVFYVKLTNEEYEYFTKKKMEDLHSIYLVRSVNYAFNESGYLIFKNEKNNLLIWHGALSSRKWKGHQKWPIIIFYNDEINEIFTNYSVVK